eukprot:CAMPEP_0117671630 /NCGR_PEP_ID=MMETSP0804-20121206/13447_1 /TAXON_ID=1074897 /ORGANISM="Tetraselmis astigmatica, Strain CCMP880" /LENGTH=382 /DNA_ID=CAMNT_0005480125 /DNA_START=212 /DNA_END=1357 /DNA_ORIENTATION=+
MLVDGGNPVAEQRETSASPSTAWLKGSGGRSSDSKVMLGEILAGDDTELHLLCGSGSLEDIQQCINKPGVDIDAAGAFGLTPLFWAAQAGRADVVRVLLQAGANVEARDCHGSSSILLAVASGHCDVLVALLAGGANPNTSGAHDIALHHAAAVGNILAVEALISAGANVNATAPADGKSALHIAAGTDDTAVIDALLRRAAVINIQDDFSFTPLHFAAGRGCLAAATVLLKRGADVSATDINGFTPLHLAAGGGHCEMVKALLSSGADPNAMSHPHQIVPLAMAAAGLNRGVAEILLEAGALTTFVVESQPDPAECSSERVPSTAEEAVGSEANPTKSGFHLNPLRAHKLVIEIIPNYEEDLCDTLNSARISTPLAELLAE